MESVYFYCAAIGGGLLVLQVLLLLFGGGDSDFDTDVSPDVDVGELDATSILFQLSLKTVVAFVTFFGLAGMASLEAGYTFSNTLLIALGAGLAAFFMVGYLMALLMRLQSKGNVDLRSAIGHSAKVYLRIPGHHSGHGKITVAVGGRMKTQKAVTAGDELATGTEVIIRGMSAPDTYEVSQPQ